MAALSVPYSFVDATQIVASQMNSNFTAVKTFVDNLSNGTNIDAGAVTTDKLAAATVQLLAPTGVVNAYAGSVAPTGWLLCDGTAVSRSTYSALFALVGTTYGVGDGSATFNLPNLKGRMPIGRDAAQAEFDVLGETGGSKTSTAPHTHNIDHNHAAFTITGGGHGHTFQNADNSPFNVINAADAAGLLITSYTPTGVGGDGSHSHTVDVPALGTTASGPSSTEAASGNLQPYLVVNYIIKT